MIKKNLNINKADNIVISVSNRTTKNLPEKYSPLKNITVMIKETGDIIKIKD